MGEVTFRGACGWMLWGLESCWGVVVVVVVVRRVCMYAGFDKFGLMDGLEMGIDMYRCLICKVSTQFFFLRG